MKESMQNISYITGSGKKKFVECAGNDTNKKPHMWHI
jgi:hypothetical protein